MVREMEEGLGEHDASKQDQEMMCRARGQQTKNGSAQMIGSQVELSWSRVDASWFRGINRFVLIYVKNDHLQDGIAAFSTTPTESSHTKGSRVVSSFS